VLLVSQGASPEISILNFSGSSAVVSPAIGKGWGSPALSPDGKHVAFLMAGADGPGIYVAGADGKDLRRLADVRPLHHQNPPVWSADGSQFAFESARSTGEGAPSTVFVIRTDGTGLVNVSGSITSAYGPSWAPDGTRLAFAGFDADRATSNVYVAEADGSTLRRLTDSPKGQGTGSVSWSPSGELISYMSQREGNSEIHVIRPDGTGDRNLTRHPGADFAAVVGGPPLAWSPDGRRIAFLSDRFGNVEVLVVDTADSNLTRLSYDPGLQFSPAWSQDGRCLTYYSSGPPTSVVIVNADGTGMSQLTTLQ
jgi:TolB protein